MKIVRLYGPSLFFSGCISVGAGITSHSVGIGLSVFGGLGLLCHVIIATTQYLNNKGSQD